MLKKIALATFCLTVMLASVSFADTIVGSAGNGFQTFGVVNENGIPFWDHASLDGSHQNIGYQLQNLGVGTLNYWGTPSGGYDLNFLFSQNGINNSATLQLEVAANAGINEFGWYQTGNTSALNPIFTGPNAPVMTTVFDPAASYGFYVKTASDTYFTQSSNNTGGETGYQHFAVFATNQTPGSEVYWLGMEDMSGSAFQGNCNPSAADFDYNDMIVKISTNSQTPVPEPSTYLLCGSALLALGFYRRRRRSS
jgi:hypothetical protein